MAFDWSELRQLLTQAVGLPRRSRAERGRRASGPPWPIRRGTLALLAGSLDDDVVVELIRRAGGRRARAVVLPSGHTEWARAGERYVRYFARFGMQRVEAADLVTRQRCNDRIWAARLQDADLVCAGGGDGALLARLLGGTLAERSLLAGLGRGTVVVLCGDAAGAAGSVALDWTAPRAAALQRGLGLLPSSLVDVQAARRGDLGRWFWALSGELLAIALDEGAGLLCGPGPQAEVVGHGCAMVVDGRQGLADMALGGVQLRVLQARWRIDLPNRSVLPPAAPGTRGGR